MWTAKRTNFATSNGLHCSIERSSQPATVGEVVHAWQNDANFRAFFNSLLADAPFNAFRWETPVVTSETLVRPFEFVLLESPGLDRRPDAEAFAAQFACATTTVATFPNLGGDAVMVVPCPIAEHSAYGHLAAFARLAPESQQQTLWQHVGDAMAKRIGAKPIWLSTAGAGVSWLHVRLDDRPKYYGYSAYRQLP